jgi:hypothetical protein
LTVATEMLNALSAYSPKCLEGKFSEVELLISRSLGS